MLELCLLSFIRNSGFIGEKVAFICEVHQAGIFKIANAPDGLEDFLLNGVFVDVRTAELFAKGHIAGSLNIGLEDIRSGNTSRIMKYQDKPVILVGKDKYDADCFNSAVSLKKQGFTKVFTMEGGISQWAMDNLPLSLKD